MKALLGKLCADPRNQLALISGRKRHDLNRWFGDVAGLYMVAEHGATLRPPDPDAWKPLRQAMSRDWMEHVRPILGHFVSRTPGNFIEEKDYSLVWHYRMAGPDFGEWLARELVAMLEGMLAETELRAIRGRKIVEGKPVWIYKGTIAERLSSAYGPESIQFAAGDDRTDEDTFEALPHDAWTLRDGKERSRARFFVPGPAQVRDVLRRFGER